MTRRTRRLPLVLIPLLLAGVLTSCGDDADGGPSTGLDAVSIEGSVGEAPEVTWESDMSADELETTTLEEGDGEEVESGDQVFTHIWIGNGFTQEQSFSTYDEGKPELVTVDDTLSPIFGDALEGQTVGSRVAVTAPADLAFGDAGNPQLGIGNKDTVLVIVDLISINVVLDGPEGEPQAAPAWAPSLVEEDGDVTALDFGKAPAPDGTLRSATLIQGTGAKVKKGQTVTVDYLGQVYGAKKPFDESFSGDSPLSRTIGAGELISGWDKTIVGARVGSRLILGIPPREGYGKQGNEQANIKGTDTIYFVVDILGAN
ncbi:FKBP-type peptidyl-prolyl cis-trans isomerase [Nocardioides sp.]|uniref:FKBP-type peptidyl-prolyl cis-trans isomerase n=1 Tax=Nocardioides sp. TaxID=35761 RepID=UPI0035668D82